jgi:hypothetical protein
MSTYTAYCGRRELLTSDNFADAMTAADQCLETAPASLVHIRRSTDGRSVKAGIAKKSLIDPSKHHIITSPHPSPFSAHNGFFGSRPFSKANAYLQSHNKTPINW